MNKPKRLPVTLHQLRVFEAVARQLSFTRAADELHLSQPTVSVQVRELAAAVGLPLFEQLGRRIRLTAAGTELLGTARAMFDTWDRFQMRVADLQGLRRGALRVSAVTTATYFVPRLLGPFSEAYPGIELSLEVARRDDIVQRLIEGRDDLYIMGVPPTDLEIHELPILDNPLVVVAPRSHRLAGRKGIPLKALEAQPFLVREQGSGTRMASERYFQRHGFKPRVRMALGSNEAIKQAVAGGFGLAVLSLHALGMDATDGGLVLLDVEGFPIRRKWYAVYPRSRPLSIVATTFLQYLRGQTGGLPNVDALLADWRRGAANRRGSPKRGNPVDRKHPAA
ncbi:MAG: LysR family transcriptional regulator [Burkholderiales bacterium]|jgi:DNA-binding transcriptional LysR family regulator|nr:LysR family transcriptional regulator [Burkholderiales bacterium]